MSIHAKRPPERIELDGLQICAPRVADAAALSEACNASLPELRQFMPWAHYPQTEEGQYERLITTVADFWAGREYVFHLRRDGVPGLVGCVGLHRRCLSDKALEVGFWVRSDQSGRGLCTLATKAVVLLAFDWFGCTRVQCAHNLQNTGSARVQDKVGFVREAQIENFESAPTAKMVEQGMLVEPVMVLRGLLPRHIDGLDWVAPARERCRIWNYSGTEVAWADASRS